MNADEPILSYRDGDAAFLVPRRPISAAVAPKLYQAGAALLREGYVKLGLDLEDVPMITSLGISTFLRLHRDSRDKGGGLVLFHIEDPVMEILDSARMGDVLTIVEDREAAREALG